MKTRQLGPFSVSSIGLGCMSIAAGYGQPPEPGASLKLLETALDSGYTHFDTAALYGFGISETLVGRALSHRRSEFTLASKCGVFKNADGKREINGHPSVIRQTCEDSLQRLQTDVIDLYYLHRWDKSVPIEDSIGELSRLVEAGKIRTIGLSEVSAATLRKAHAVHAISAVQSEYSLWTRNPEIEVLQACRDINASFVAFSPLARKFLTGTLLDLADLQAGDLRLGMPRFQAETYAQNLALLSDYRAIADEVGASMSELALAWVLAKGDDILPIPGTTSLDHLAENARADEVTLSDDVVARLDKLINQHTVHGPRYNAQSQREVDSVEYEHHTLI